MVSLIPQTMSEWNFETLQRTLEIPDIEEERFDFKSNKALDKDYRLEDHICAFANTYGGHIVIGVSEKRMNKNYKKFILDGFDDGSQDENLKRIAQKIWLIEPLPSYEVTTIESQGKYYIVLYIKQELHKRPFFVRNNCYVRMGSSTIPANRNIMLSLMNYNIVTHEDRRKHTEYIVNIYRQLTNLSVIRINQQYLLAIHENSMTLNSRFENNIMTIGGAVDLDKITQLHGIYHLDLAIAHLKCEEYHKKYRIFEQIKSVLEHINTNPDILNEETSSHIPAYPVHIVDYFKHNYKTGYKLYMLILRFREEIYHLIRDVSAGDTLRGFCKIGY